MKLPSIRYIKHSMKLLYLKILLSIAKYISQTTDRITQYVYREAMNEIKDINKDIGII